MIHFLIGKPRNGKSLRAMMHIVEQITTTARDVVTNMVLDLDELQMLLDERGHGINVRRRIRMLETKEQMRHFWLYRVGYDLPKPADYEDKNGGDLDYSPIFRDPRFFVGGAKALEQIGPISLRGTCYVIDEIHTIYPARGWQGTPRHAEFYCSQHGKLNDECWFITQNTKLVDPNFYRLAQDFTYCRNHRLLKFGVFKGENKFVAKTYESPVATGNETTLNVDTFKLDLSVARCYDTSAGVGMPGGGTADGGKRAKGVPLKMVWLGLAAVLVCASWFFEKGLGMFLNFTLGGGAKPVAKAPAVPGAAVAAAPAPAAAAPSYDQPAAPDPADKVLGMAAGRFCVSWVADGGEWVTYEQAADTPARAALLRRFAGWRPRPALAAAN